MGENRVQRQRWQRKGGVRHRGPLAAEKPLQTALRNTTPFLFSIRKASIQLRVKSVTINESDAYRISEGRDSAKTKCLLHMWKAQNIMVLFDTWSENANRVLALGHSCALTAHYAIKSFNLRNKGKRSDVLTFYFTLAAERIHLLLERKS